VPEVRAVLVLEHLVQAGTVAVHFASAGPLLGNFARPDLAPDLPVLLHGPDLWSGILCGLRLGILYGLYGSDRCPCIFVGRPSLELT
jgi:hypothetical protein